MKSFRPLALSLALGLTASPALAQQAPAPGADLMRFVNRLATQYLLLTARSFVDMTYDSVTIAPNGRDLTITGLKLYPILDWDQNGECEISIDRISGGDVLSFETLQSRIEVSDIHVPLACLDPMQGGMLAQFGYGEGLTAERMSIDVSYDMPTSAAEFSVQTSVAGVADISLDASFDYLWFRIPTDGHGGDPEPAALLGQVEVTVTNGGIWEQVEPMIAGQLGGDIAALPQMAGAMIPQALSGPQGPSPEVTAFAQNVSGELDRFIKEKNRIVITSAPENGLWLRPGLFNSPAEAIAILQPEVSAIPYAQRSLISPDELQAALAGGSGMSDDDRLRIGTALLTGIGAPRALGEGTALLSPLAEAWHPEAAGLLAEAADEVGDSATAYPLVLRAMAGGYAGASGLADDLESRLALADVLAAQDAAGQAWPGADDLVAESARAVAAGDVAALRNLAYRAASGQGMPRNAIAAYYWASLAAAGGDKGAASLRQRLDAYHNARDAAAWQPHASQAASQALETWTKGGLGATLTAGK